MDVMCREMFRKLKKAVLVIYYYFKDSDNLLLYLMYFKALEILNSCYKLSVRNTEDLEDLIFHIRAYLDIPRALTEFKYPEFKGLNIKDILKKYKRKKLKKDEALRFTDYLQDVERQRAVERDFIFENAKILTFGFEF